MPPASFVALTIVSTSKTGRTSRFFRPGSILRWLAMGTVLMLVLAGLSAAGAPAAEPNFNDSSAYGSIVSKDAYLRASSTSTEDKPELHGRLFKGEQLPFAFHTSAETNPSVIVVLNGIYSITGLDIVNRTDHFAEFGSHVANLKVSVSADAKNWTKIWEASSAEPEWKISLIASHRALPHARFLKLEINPEKAQEFFLSRVTVYGS